MKEVKNKFRERDEMETYFSDAKRKSFPVGVLFILLILIAIGGCLYYYFIIDSPKNIFLISLNNVSSNIKIDDTNHEKLNIDFNLDLNLITNKNDYIELTNIINEISLTGNVGIDYNKKEDYVNIKALYEEKDLFGLTEYTKDDIMYLNLDKIYNKTIKYKLTEEEIKEMDSIYNNTETEDNKNTKKILDSFSKHLIDTLEEAEYTKEYIELDETLVKKVTLLIDKPLMESFYNKLLNDKDFMKNYSDFEDITESELEEKINKGIDALENGICEVSLYLSILKNEFIKIEIIDGEYRVILFNENDEIGYKYYENSIIKYQGYILLKKTNSNYQVSFSIEDIEAEITVELNADFTLDYEKEIKNLDTTNTIDVEALTDDDYNKIVENITNNEVLSDLTEDLNSLFSIYNTENNYLQTT